MSLPEPILMLLHAPVDVREFHLWHEDGNVILTVKTSGGAVKIVNPYPLNTAWSLFMDDPGEVQIADVRSRQLEAQGFEVSTVNGEGEVVRFLAQWAGPAAERLTTGPSLP